MNNSNTSAKFSLNKVQARILLTMARTTWLCAGRGFGKTVGVTTPWTLHKVEAMPGSAGFLLGQSFSDLEAKILKPLFEGFSKMGHKKDIHYTYGIEPPKSWDRPIMPVIDWKRVIAFPNGTVCQLISLHQKGSANSNSFQWGLGPECKYFKQSQIQGEVMPTLRGNVEHFGNSPWYGSTLFETDKLGSNIHWILEKRKEHDEEVVAAIIFYQLQINELHKKLISVSESHAYKIREKINRLDIIAGALRRNLTMFAEGRAIDNIANLSPDFFTNMRKHLSAYEYSIAIDNEDPTTVEDGFYPDKDEDNLHNRPFDEDEYKPLAVAFDWQASITPLVCCQLNDRVIPGTKTLNFIRSMYVKYPKGIPTIVKEFCELYKSRPCKVVLFYYDHTAIGKQNERRTHNEEVIKAFQDNGWKVVPIYMGQAPLHETKFNRINYFLRGEGKYKVMFHIQRCEQLLLSMDLSEVKAGSTFEKDKTDEKNKNIPQELTTHFSDTADQLMIGILELGIYPESGRTVLGSVGILG